MVPPSLVHFDMICPVLYRWTCEKGAWLCCSVGIRFQLSRDAQLATGLDLDGRW
jgi:hypothetical protein